MKDYLEKRREELGKRDGGFTLMEMLIVVAIIAVLIAIAIPIFTSQLEKSREATDLSNIRSCYAEISAGILTNGMDQDEATMTVMNGLTATTSASDGSFDIEVAGVPVAQTVEEWQTEGIEVAGLALATTNCPEPASEDAPTTTITYTFTVNNDTTYLSAIEFA